MPRGSESDFLSGRPWKPPGRYSLVVFGGRRLYCVFVAMALRLNFISTTLISVGKQYVSFNLIERPLIFIHLLYKHVQ